MAVHKAVKLVVVTAVLSSVAFGAPSRYAERDDIIPEEILVSTPNMPLIPGSASGLEHLHIARARPNSRVNLAACVTLTVMPACTHADDAPMYTRAHSFAPVSRLSLTAGSLESIVPSQRMSEWVSLCLRL